MGCESQLVSKYLFTPIFRRAILTRKVGQTDQTKKDITAG